jgi:hypothetical protein
MSGFNFGQIGNIISEFFDTDYVDIKRDTSGQLQEVYSNIPCHIAFSSVDNPNPETVDIKPIIQSLTIHFALWVDIKNNDFIIAKKMDNDGNLLAVYSGRCGNPIVSQGRKKVSVIMSATESEIPTPVPPKNPINIKLEYLSDGVQIKDSINLNIEKGDNFTLSAPLIDNYLAVDCQIDDELQGSTTAIINNVQEEHTVKFIYESISVSTGFRYLVKGLYTKNDSSLANGYHLYKKLNIDSISEEDNVYTITCDDTEIEHEDNGEILEISVGAKLVLVPNDIFVKVTEVITRINGKVTFNAIQFTPTQEELNAYVCDWYD